MISTEIARRPATPHPYAPAVPPGEAALGLPAARFYLQVARRAFRRQLAYRAANLAGMATNVVWGIIRASIFTALFTARPHAAGLTLPLALTYGWITEGLLMVTMLWGWTDVAEAIRSGDVVSDMARPYHLQTYWLFRDAGRALYYTLFRGLPVVAAGACLYPFVGPPSPWIALLFALSVALGTLTSFSWRFLVNVTAFWTTDVRGMAAISGLVAVFFSGEQAPLAFYPGWLQTVASLLPFQSMIAAPMNIYLGRTGGLGLIATLAVQLGWAAALLALGRYALARGYRKVEANGG
jgi:ABC-2 type transport system permease protein